MEVWRRGLARSGPSSIVPLINATVDLDTLLRRGGRRSRRAHPAHRRDRRPRTRRRRGHRRAARPGRRRRALTDASGATLWYGRSRRLATPAQRAAVIAAGSGHCCFPGCTIAAERCEIDHLEGWAHGGGTDIDNLGLLCPFHNRLKHRWNLRVTRSADGTLVWHHPDGAEIRSRYRTTSGPPPPGTTAPISRRDDADPSGASGCPDGSTPPDRGP
ncbi:MAG: HNH endonuclease signature motif containing protein [Acidimicrobiales bacterium]